MQGLPGSGKTHYTKAHFQNAVICSSEHFFEVNGVYKFDKTQLSWAHGNCFKRAVEAVTSGAPEVIIDNTNTTELECAPYMALANAFGCDSRIIRIDADVDLCSDRNIHNVPLRTIMDLSDRLRRFRPLKWWNFHIVRNYG